jgi:DNA-binding transcriptional ArsR family regulator
MVYDIYSAFGNKARAKLLLCLEQKSKSVNELIATCGLSQSAVSQHLKKLKEARLVKTAKDGKQVYYSLRYKNAASISRQLLTLESEVV